MSNTSLPLEESPRVTQDQTAGPRNNYALSLLPDRTSGVGNYACSVFSSATRAKAGPEIVLVTAQANSGESGVCAAAFARTTRTIGCPTPAKVLFRELTGFRTARVLFFSLLAGQAEIKLAEAVPRGSWATIDRGQKASLTGSKTRSVPFRSAPRLARRHRGNDASAARA